MKKIGDKFWLNGRYVEVVDDCAFRDECFRADEYVCFDVKVNNTLVLAKLPQEPEIELECRVEHISFLYGMRYFKTVSGFKAWKKLPWYKKFKKHESEEA